MLALDKAVDGTIRTKGDKDHFKVVLDKAGVLEVLVKNVDPNLSLIATIYDEDKKRSLAA